MLAGRSTRTPNCKLMQWSGRQPSSRTRGQGKVHLAHQAGVFCFLCDLGPPGVPFRFPPDLMPDRLEGVLPPSRFFLGVWFCLCMGGEGGSCQAPCHAPR